MALKWIAELPPKYRRGPALPIRELDAKPGQWALLRTYQRGNSAFPTASRLRLRYPSYEFEARAVNGKGSVLYGRKLK